MILNKTAKTAICWIIAGIEGKQGERSEWLTICPPVLLITNLYRSILFCDVADLLRFPALLSCLDVMPNRSNAFFPICA
jgi:hypothetical protein